MYESCGLDCVCPFFALIKIGEVHSRESQKETHFGEVEEGGIVILGAPGLGLLDVPGDVEAVAFVCEADNLTIHVVCLLKLNDF